ncbi:MAG: hypothetical protein ACC608_12195 [Anaerofustis sp.]
MTVIEAIAIVKQYFDGNAMTLKETDAFLTLLEFAGKEIDNECNLLSE